ncbi:MAG: hypothetical protein U0002_05835 [Thermoanaerobaculia bacterium]
MLGPVSVHESLAYLAESLDNWVQSCGENLGNLSEAIGRHRSYLPRALAGKQPLKLAPVFEALAPLPGGAVAFFDAAFPFGGAMARLARERTSQLVSELLRTQPAAPTEQLTRRAADRLRFYLKRAGVEQSALSESLGLGPRALPLALHQHSSLSFFHLFGVLEATGVSPALCFAEVFTGATGTGEEAARVSLLLGRMEKEYQTALAEYQAQSGEARPSKPINAPPSPEPSVKKPGPGEPEAGG